MQAGLNPHARPFAPCNTTLNFSSFLPNKNRFSLRLGTINARSWSSKADELSNFFQTASLDVLAVTETWLRDSFPSSILTPTVNHTIIRRDRAVGCQVRGGGVAFLISPSTHFTHRPDLEPQGVEISCIELTKCDCLTFLFSCYRPPNTDPTIFERALHKVVSQVSSISPHANVILLGDFNARFTGWNATDPSTPAGRLLSGLFDSEGLSQLVGVPTRYSASGRECSLLDLVVTKQPFKVLNLSVLPTISDHCPIVFDLVTNISQSSTLPSTTSCKLDLSNVNWGQLQSDVWDLPLLSTVVDAPDVDDAWITWKRSVEQVILNSVPYRPSIHRPNTKPWFYAAHHQLRRRRDRLFAAAKRSGTAAAWAAYRLSRNSFTTAIRRSKSEYYMNMSRSLEEGKGSYKWWKKLKSICKIDKPQSSIPDLELPTSTATSDISKANAFSELFAGYSSAPSNPNSYTPLASATPVPDTFSIGALTKGEVFLALKKLPTHKITAGILSNTILKKIAPAIAESLTALFNRSITSASFPTDWKLSTA